MSRFLIIILSLFSINLHAQDKKPWVYFDIGNTIISTKVTNHYKYINGTREYIEDLKREGFKVGLISNIPENWGSDYDEKLLSLKKYVQDSWGDNRPFDWSVYDEVILPLKDNELKPSPTLFLRAISKAELCPSVYIGENQIEINAAKATGMAAKLFNEADSELFIPINKLRAFIASNYQNKYDPDCL